MVLENILIILFCCCWGGEADHAGRLGETRPQKLSPLSTVLPLKACLGIG
jgi:hypothetical protein